MQPVRSSSNWTRPPGKMDALHTANIFDSDNIWGLPVIGNTGNLQPAELWPYNIRTRSNKQKQSAVHFYLDDYQFEIAWTNPPRALSYVSRFAYVITPDFSIWSHWPKVLQLFNLYRSRWCGAYWMSNGLTVIPSVSWADPSSYQYSFAAIKPESTIAISSLGIRSQAASAVYLDGLQKMIYTIKPSNIICYGQPILTLCNQTTYPTFWEQRKPPKPTRPEAIGEANEPV